MAGMTALQALLSLCSHSWPIHHISSVNHQHHQHQKYPLLDLALLRHHPSLCHVSALTSYDQINNPCMWDFFIPAALCATVLSHGNSMNSYRLSDHTISHLAWYFCCNVLQVLGLYELSTQCIQLFSSKLHITSFISHAVHQHYIWCWLPARSHHTWGASCSCLPQASTWLSGKQHGMYFSKFYLQIPGFCSIWPCQGHWSCIPALHCAAQIFPSEENFMPMGAGKFLYLQKLFCNPMASHIWTWVHKPQLLQCRV